MQQGNSYSNVCSVCQTGTKISKKTPNAYYVSKTKFSLSSTVLKISTGILEPV